MGTLMMRRGFDYSDASAYPVLWVICLVIRLLEFWFVWLICFAREICLVSHGWLLQPCLSEQLVGLLPNSTLKVLLLIMRSTVKMVYKFQRFGLFG